VIGPEGKEYDHIMRVVFSPDSGRVAYWARRGDNWLVVVDGVEGTGYDNFVFDSGLVFDSPTSLHTLAIRGDEIRRVEITIVEE